MNRKLRILLALSFMFLLGAAFVYADESESQSLDSAGEKLELLSDNSGSWVETNGNTFYRDQNGNYAKGIYEIDGDIYYFDPTSGTLRKNAGWISWNGKRYFINSEGIACRNRFVSYGPYRIYLGADGSVPTGLYVANDGHIYKADGSAEVAKKAKWIESNGKRYLTSETGEIYKNQFVAFGPHRYYLGPDGAAITDVFTANDGENYNAGSTGEIDRESQLIEKNGNKYFSNDDGKLYKNQFISYGSVRYYVGADGAVVKGIFTANNGKKYAADSNGALYKNQFVTSGAYRYYLNEDGSVATGIFTASNGKKYAANADGQLYKNQFITLGSAKYYINEDGSLATGIFTTSDGRIFNADENTGEIIRVAQWIEKNGKRYFSNSEGELYKNEFISFGSRKYYMGPDGAVVIGSFSHGGKNYKTKSDGEAYEVNIVTTGQVASTVGVNVRPTAGTDYSPLFALPYNEYVTILNSAPGSDGYTWRYISHAKGKGYIRSDLIYNITTTETEVDPGTGGTTPPIMNDSEFEQYMIAQGFPESYKPYLRKMHKEHPTWIFKAAQTGLDWNYVITKESKPGVNTVHISHPASYKSKDPNALNPDGSHKIYDSGGYVAASRAIIEYYMDPRNSFDDTFFQFLSNSYDGNTQTLDGIGAIVKGTFLSMAFPEGGYSSYASLLLQAGRTYGVNPLILASKIINEHGTSGNSDSISGTVPGYEGYYNYFNIGAYAHSGRSAIENGLIYAKSQGWNSREKSIMGGTEFFAKDYIQGNKTTAYFQKFNVMNGASAVATGQYMTAVWGANSTGKTLGEGYAAAYSSALSFDIPVYQNMPSLPVPQPK